MKNFFTLLQKTKLFQSISDEELSALLPCLKARKCSFRREELLLSAGDSATELGVVLSGSVRVVQEDYWGRRSILAIIHPGELFGEAFACAHTTWPVSVIAKEESLVLMLDGPSLLSPCAHACPQHNRLIQNMLQIVAEKNIQLTEKIDYLSKKTIEERVMAYLSAYAAKNGSNAFSIPLNRQEMADFLSVDRSALSAALSIMQKKGILTFHKNKFQIHTN